MFVAVREPHLIDGWGSTAAGAEALGVSHIEITVSREKRAARLTDGLARMFLETDEDINTYRALLKNHDLAVSAVLMYNDFGAADWEGEIEWLVWAVNLCDKLDGAVLRIDPIMSTEDQWPFEQRVARAVESLRRIIESTPYSNVSIAMENHGNQGNQPEFLDAVISGVGSPRLGMNIDTANFYWYGYPLGRVYEIIRHFAPHTKHTHVKNINYPADKRGVQREVGWGYGDYCCALREGNIDLQFVVEVLRANGYEGDLCVEDESLGRFDPEQRREILRDDVQYVKSLL